MDKILLIIVFFFNVINFGHTFSCIPNSTFQMDCNTCTCNSAGDMAACTLMACSEQISTTTEDSPVTNGNQVCTPNEIKMQDEENGTCNRCKCAANGIGWFCTKIVCPPRDIHTRSVRQTQEECTPGTDWKEDCNTCFCSPTGLKACTRMACPPQNPRNKREINEFSCTPGQRWKKDCNDCFCTETGLAACTLKGCLGRNDGIHSHRSHNHHQPRGLPSSIPVISRDELNRVDFRCTPHEYFKVDCNNCRCSSDGKMLKCAKKPCDVHKI